MPMLNFSPNIYNDFNYTEGYFHLFWRKNGGLILSSSRKQEQDFVIEDGELVQYNGPGGDVVIPDQVDMIDFYVFMYRNDLISVTLPKGLRIIGAEAFHGCENLKEVRV